MRVTLPTILLAGALAFWLPRADAQTNCPPYRPCGVGETWGGNRLVKQGFFGADFRPACQAHDTCEASPRDCDRQFLCDMYAACESSTNPGKCRKKARSYFLGSRVYHSFAVPLRRLFHTQ
ncbi:MAG: hypothetical protein P4L85_08260 [Paludisphaera borealis]|uniref:hypothetical protein n=1 Tax=Paludisphaera borealis TaxID=1387353 RepID=UPI00284DDF4F|nr:hypothetical protein [Paludisphaera borealis]MDR3619329.1 hypothetical protein [Paludisphaera borealis]